MKSTCLRLGLGCLLFLFMPLRWAIADQTFPVGTIENLVLHDSSRNREVPLKIYYPQTQNPSSKFPIIFFSHGAGGSKDGYGYLGKFWASHGYICIHPDHEGSDSRIIRRGRPLLTLRAIKQSVQNPENLINRPLDISFILDSLS
jgi:predicted dienelactone hydrolase